MREKKTDETASYEKRSERRKFKPTAAFYGLICVIIGIIDLVNPERMLNIIAYALGISAIVCGLVFIIVYMARDVKYNLNNNDFLSGLIAVVVGIVILIKWQQFMELLPIVLGVLIIVSGCIKLQDAIDLKKLDHPAFVMILVIALVFIVFGAVLVANPFKSEIILMRIIGVSLVIAGMTDLFTYLFYEGIRKTHQPDAIETTYEEADDKADEKK